MQPSGAGSIRVHALYIAPQVWCIRIEGTVQDADVGALETALEGAKRSEATKVIINLGRIGDVSSEGLRWLLKTHLAGIQTGVETIFCACPVHLQELLNQLGLAKVLRFADDETSALTSGGA